MNDQPYNVFAFCKALPRSILSHGAQRLLYLMATMWADRAGVCYPSESLLARESGYTPRHVRRLVTEAANAGWLMVQQGGGRVSNLYALMVGDMAVERDTNVHVQTFSGYGCPSRLDTGVHLTSHGTAHRTQAKNKPPASKQEIDSQEGYYAREAVSLPEDLPCVRAEGVFFVEQQEQAPTPHPTNSASPNPASKLQPPTKPTPAPQAQDLAAQLLDLQAMINAKRPAYLAAKQAVREQAAKEQAEREAQEAAQDLATLQDFAPMEEAKGGGLEGVEVGREILHNPSPCDLPEEGGLLAHPSKKPSQDLAALQTNTLRGAGSADGGGVGGAVVAVGEDGAQTALGGAVGSFRASDGRGVGSGSAGASAGLVGAVLGGAASEGGLGADSGDGEMSPQEQAATLRRAWGKMLFDVFGLDVEALRAAGRGLPESRKVSREALAGLSFAQSLTVVAGVYELMGREGVIGSLPRVVGMLRGKVEARALVVREWSPLECRLLLEGYGWRASMEEAARREARQEEQGGRQEVGGRGVRAVPERIAEPARAAEPVRAAELVRAEPARAAELGRVAEPVRAALGGLAGYKALLASLCAPVD